MDHPTKYYSNKQETSIAKFLGWDVVSGSGARDFNPGDIISEEWLGECKTHTKEIDLIKFDLNVWNKIQSESMSLMKRAALFADNGTQTVENTWCLIPQSACMYIKTSDYLINRLERSAGRLVFVHKQVKMHYEPGTAIKLSWGKGIVLLMDLKTFREQVLRLEDA